LKIIRKVSKLVAIFLAFYMLMPSGRCRSVWAAMISTESIINADQGQSPRDYLNSFFAREEIQAVLVSQGIDPQEARNRIDSLSDVEIGKFLQEIDQLPAGGSLGVIFFFIMVLALVAVDIFFNNPAQNN
jgi:Family of unknown function (DUF6627)